MGTPMNYVFDASQYEPQQGMQSHPPYKGRAYISKTEIVPTKKGDGGMFVVTFTTDAGTIQNRYNLWNANNDAVRIAQGELSALCHAVNVHQVDMSNEGAALINAQCLLEIAPQKNDPRYSEIVKVYRPDGAEPTRQGAIAPQGGPGGFTPPGGASGPTPGLGNAAPGGGAWPAPGGPGPGNTPPASPNAPWGAGGPGGGAPSAGNGGGAWPAPGGQQQGGGQPPQGGGGAWPGGGAPQGGGAWPPR